MRNHHAREFRVVKVQVVAAFDERWAVAPAAIHGQHQTRRSSPGWSLLREITFMQRCGGEQRGCRLHEIASVHKLSKANSVSKSEVNNPRTLRREGRSVSIGTAVAYSSASRTPSEARTI